MCNTGIHDDISILDIDNPFPGSISYYLPLCSSTMDVARRLSSTALYGLVRTGEQSNGRGRLPGRLWHGSKEESLLVTMWLPIAAFGDAPPPLLAGLALKRACESWASEHGLSFTKGLNLKWPNDLLCDGRKIAGLLCETSGSTVYVGIGLNCLQEEFPTGFNTDPGSIYMQTGKKPELNDMAAGLAKAFHGLLGAPSGWKNEYESAMAWRQRRVCFVPGIDSPPVHGILLGIDDGGSIIMSLDGEPTRRSFASGELRRY